MMNHRTLLRCCSSLLADCSESIHSTAESTISSLLDDCVMFIVTKDTLLMEVIEFFVRKVDFGNGKHQTLQRQSQCVKKVRNLGAWFWRIAKVIRRVSF